MKPSKVFLNTRNAVYSGGQYTWNFPQTMSTKSMQCESLTVHQLLPTLAPYENNFIFDLSDGVGWRNLQLTPIDRIYETPQELVAAINNNFDSFLLPGNCVASYDTTTFKITFTSNVPGFKFKAWSSYQENNIMRRLGFYNNSDILVNSTATGSAPLQLIRTTYFDIELVNFSTNTYSVLPQISQNTFYRLINTFPGYGNLLSNEGDTLDFPTSQFGESILNQIVIQIKDDNGQIITDFNLAAKHQLVIALN